MIVRYRRLRPEAKVPEYHSAWAAGMDLHAAGDRSYVIRPGRRALVPTGLALEIPPGYEGQIRPRSGLALHHGVTVLNTPGTVDSDFRGEVCVVLANVSPESYVARPGDRIAQLVIAPVTRVRLELADDLSSTERGAGGFGSTGL